MGFCPNQGLLFFCNSKTKALFSLNLSFLRFAFPNRCFLSVECKTCCPPLLPTQKIFSLSRTQYRNRAPPALLCSVKCTNRFSKQCFFLPNAKPHVSCEQNKRIRICQMRNNM